MYNPPAFIDGKPVQPRAKNGTWKSGRFARLCHRIFTYWFPRFALCCLCALLLGRMVYVYGFGPTIDAVNPVQVAAAAEIIDLGQHPIIPPILQKIAMAESHGHQFYFDGSPVHHDNTNGTTDWGKYQINSIWLQQAEEMGYDVVNSEKDNEAMALWLFSNYGSEPWNSSKARWNK